VISRDNYENAEFRRVKNSIPKIIIHFHSFRAVVTFQVPLWHYQGKIQNDDRGVALGRVPH
jgi:hypothetical protein